MRININKNALKGQHIPAQGNALGLRASKEIVRAISIIKENWLFPTKKMALWFSKNDIQQFRPKGLIYFVPRITADGFSGISFTQGDISVRSSLNFALG